MKTLPMYPTKLNSGADLCCTVNRKRANVQGPAFSDKATSSKPIEIGGPRSCVGYSDGPALM
jgi:hypothetical protein